MCSDHGQLLAIQEELNGWGAGLADKPSATPDPTSFTSSSLLCT